MVTIGKSEVISSSSSEASSYEHNRLCVGIDLGTTNSVLAYANTKSNGDVVSIVLDIDRAVDAHTIGSGETRLSQTRRPTLPSCVFYRDGNSPIVGDYAKRQHQLRPRWVAKSIKSQMGRPLAEGLDPSICDKTPAEISARILKHMLANASRRTKTNITDAVITVPANFDSAMCAATRDAAAIAGIKVKNADGSERPILLSEPNAVIYDLINRIQNGEIPNDVLDLSSPKRVMVFDLGGGTLDITMHEIKRRDDNKEVLKVSEIATNRYTLLGGDDFDRALAEAMYPRYLKQYSSHPDVVRIINSRKDEVMPQLIGYAEELKLYVNERYTCGDADYDSGWGYEDNESFPVGGNMGGIGYSYDDDFTQAEIEEIFSRFMAPSMKYDDYKRISQITDTRNIIYPILDVLSKAAAKLQTANVTVDAVILNGGMTKFYMVPRRLTEFFGFEPIVALDPDQSVARGAAVYHYYLHQYEELKDDMTMIGDGGGTVSRKSSAPVRPPLIEWGSNILNDSLYLGARNGAVCEIIPTGAELPYTSKVMDGFRIDAGKNRISIPIKARNLDGSYRVIANGNMMFKSSYPNGAYVSFTVEMSKSKVITFNAWTSSDKEGAKRIEDGTAEIEIGNRNTAPSSNTRFIVPNGSPLNPVNEISSLFDLCTSFDRSTKQIAKSSIAKRIKQTVDGILSASNREEFAEPILNAFSRAGATEAFYQRLFIIARRIGGNWSDENKSSLARIAMSHLSADISGLSFSGGPKTSTNIEAILTLCMCGTTEQIESIEPLHANPKYLNSCLYTHGRTQTCLDWIVNKFFDDSEMRFSNRSSNLQLSAYVLGLALHNNHESGYSSEDIAKTAYELCDLLKSGLLTMHELSNCIVALGYICDTREGSELPGSVTEAALDVIKKISSFNSPEALKSSAKSCDVAAKMISGDMLSDDDEEHLLIMMENNG